MTAVFSFEPGNTPLLLSVPHAGTLVPSSIRDRFTAAARKLPDTDWDVDRLYSFVRRMGVGLLTANFSRYVIDLNRPPDDSALYSVAGTGLIPEYSFDGEALYCGKQQPDTNEINTRKVQYWQPYHDKIQTELQVLKKQHGYAILLDAHSIRDEVPLLFTGKLPDLNLGSDRGQSADAGLIAAAMLAITSDRSFSTVLDGRFQGGYITRHYGQPQNDIHALQLEMAQSVYMHRQPPVIDETKVKKNQPVLRKLVNSLLQWSPSRD